MNFNQKYKFKADKLASMGLMWPVGIILPPSALDSQLLWKHILYYNYNRKIEYQSTIFFQVSPDQAKWVLQNISICQAKFKI